MPRLAQPRKGTARRIGRELQLETGQLQFWRTGSVAISSERLIVRELKCFMCGYTLGEVVANALQRMFRRAPDCPPPADSRLSRMRCPRCEGPVYLEGAETTTQWSVQPARASAAMRHN
jgi:hypothetical protein